MATDGLAETETETQYFHGLSELTTYPTLLELPVNANITDL